MALTATATEAMKEDIISKLGLKNDCIRLTQSFNRPNLTYKVVPKVKGVVQSMAEWILENHPSSTGIVYCFSKNNCEEVAKNLREKHRLNALHYHAGMEANEKKAAYQKWKTGKVNIIVATVRLSNQCACFYTDSQWQIAFGMGYV